MGDQRCALCGGESHPSPDTRADQFGLICPGPDACHEDQHTYRAALTQAYLDYLTREAQEYVDTVARRRELWYSRERTEVTHEELQADCDARVAQRHPEGIGSQPGPVAADLEIDPPHLTVPGRFYRGMRNLRPGGRRTKDGDEMLFMPTQEEESGP